MSVGTAPHGTRVPWVDVLLSAIAAVSWALIGMAGTAALGLRLLEADTAGSLGPMTAAVVALGAGGSVTPSGEVSVFGLEGAEATTAVEITPWGVSLVGALLLSWFFLRSLRAAGVVVAPAELLARAGAVIALFVATLGGLAWAGRDVVTFDGGSLGLDDLVGGSGDGSGSGPGSEGVGIPGLGDLGDIGDIGGLLPDRVGDLVGAEAAVGFSVDTAPTLLGGAAWVTGVLVVALLASRRTPLPRGWDVVHRAVRPTVSALVAVVLLAVAAGCAAAAYAAIGDDHPKRIAGAALLGAPNGVWLGLSIGLFVPWDGEASGVLARFLPDPLDDLLVDTDQPVTLGRLAELDGRVWLLAVAAGLALLLAGVLQAVRTPVGRAGRDVRDGDGAASNGVRGRGAAGFVGRCALRLAAVTACALPLLGLLTEVSLDASLSVLGIDAFGAGLELSAHLGMALLLGAAWGAAAGAGGALLAWSCGAAGRRVAPPAWGQERARGRGDGERHGGAYPEGSGPYAPGTPYRPPNPATNPYLRLPGRSRDRETEVLRRPDAESRGGAPAVRSSGSASPPTEEGLYDAPTVARPMDPTGRPPGRPPAARPGGPSGGRPGGQSGGRPGGRPGGQSGGRSPGRPGSPEESPPPPPPAPPPPPGRAPGGPGRA
ncbi:MAG TPA: streptophobe family protein [Streptomyces sp.]|nr:streptophobe family protein [Streptomyces sp.]